MTQIPFPNIPGPKGLPLFGVGLKFQSRGCDFLTDLSAQYGRIVRFPIPGISGVLVSDKDLVKLVLLQSERQFYKGKSYEFISSVVGLGLVTNQGPFWRQQRRLLSPTFQPQALGGIDTHLERFSAVLISKISDSVARSEPLATSTSMMELTFGVLIEAFFSGDLADQYPEMSQAFATIQSWIGSRLVSFFRPPLSLPTPSNLRLRQALAIFKKATGQLISERSSQKREARDLLDQLMMARHGDTGEPLSEQHIVDEVLTFLIAGHDTTALTLAYTCALLAENPAALTNLQAELQVLKGAQDFSAKNLSKLPKLNQCLLESMRLLPAVYMINRSNREPFTYKQWTFPRDTTFFVSQYATHRDPEYWPDPLAYKPERFANGEPTDFSFFPFAGGPRTCIGNHLAMIEARGVLARILRHFVPTKLAHPFKVSPYLTSIPEPGISLWWKKRE